MSTPKCEGGMRILNLEAQNICLLSKWLFKLLNEDETWQKLLRRKYPGDTTLTQGSKKPRDSQFFSGLMEIKDLFVSKGKFKIQSGNQTRFWEDLWIGDRLMKEVYPSLYNITRRRSEIVAKVLSTIPINVSFRRALTGNRLALWLYLVRKVANFMPNNENDTFV